MTTERQALVERLRKLAELGEGDDREWVQEIRAVVAEAAEALSSSAPGETPTDPYAEMMELRAGWDSYGASPIDALAITSAKAFEAGENMADTPHKRGYPRSHEMPSEPMTTEIARIWKRRALDAEKRCIRVARGLEDALTFRPRPMLDTAVRLSIDELRAVEEASPDSQPDTSHGKTPALFVSVDEGWSCVECHTFVPGTSIDLAAAVCRCGIGKGRWGACMRPLVEKLKASPPAPSGWQQRIAAMDLRRSVNAEIASRLPEASGTNDCSDAIKNCAPDPIAAAVDAQLDPLKDELKAIGHRLVRCHHRWAWDPTSDEHVCDLCGDRISAADVAAEKPQ